MLPEVTLSSPVGWLQPPLYEMGISSKSWKYFSVSRGVSPKAPGEATSRCWHRTNWTTCFACPLVLLDTGAVQMASAWVLPPPDHVQLEVDIPSAPDPPKRHPGRHQTVVGLVCFVYPGCGVSLRVFSRLFGCFLSPCFSMYGITQPRSSAPKEGDDVTAEFLY